MLTLELLCLLIVGIHITVAATRAPSPAIFLRRVALVALASWVAEDTCLHLYNFYAYHPDWVPYIDRMPLMVALIWPGVVMSSLELAQRLLGPLRRRLVPLVAGLMVLADASFMEPLAVKAGLWRWFEPGFFGVPPIGVLGWAFFSVAAMTVFCRTDRTSARWTADLWVVVVAPATSKVVVAILPVLVRPTVVVLPLTPKVPVVRLPVFVILPEFVRTPVLTIPVVVVPLVTLNVVVPILPVFVMPVEVAAPDRVVAPVTPRVVVLMLPLLVTPVVVVLPVTIKLSGAVITVSAAKAPGTITKAAKAKANDVVLILNSTCLSIILLL